MTHLTRIHCHNDKQKQSRLSMRIKNDLPLWKQHPLYQSGFPHCPTPFSPVHSALKFSAVFGTRSLNNSITTLPAEDIIKTGKLYVTSSE